MIKNLKFKPLFASFIVLAVVILPLVLVVHGEALIQIASKQKLCFQESIKEGTPMKMKIKLHSHPTQSLLRVVGKDLTSGGDKLFDLFYDLDSIERKNVATGREEELEMIKQLDYSFTTGMISYYDADEVSTYQVCLYNKEGAGPIELSFELEKANQYEELESVTHIKKIETLLSNLNFQISSITSEQLYIKGREERFRVTTDSTYNRVWVVAVIQFIILVTATWWQLASLKGFFKKQKLI